MRFLYRLCSLIFENNICCYMNIYYSRIESLFFTLSNGLGCYMKDGLLHRKTWLFAL